MICHLQRELEAKLVDDNSLSSTDSSPWREIKKFHEPMSKSAWGWVTESSPRSGGLILIRNARENYCAEVRWSGVH